MAKTKNDFFTSGGFAQFRQQNTAPTARSLIDRLWYLPAGGIADLSEQSNYQPLSPDLITAIAPLSAVTESPEEAEAQRQQLLSAARQEIRGNPTFLPEDFITDDPVSDIKITSDPRVLDRHRSAEQRSNMELSDQVDKYPLEILAREQYRGKPVPRVAADGRQYTSGPAYGAGIGHYVYDPLTERWLLINRWGRGAMKKRSQTITPYVQFGSLINRQYDVLSQIESEQLKSPGSVAFTAINNQQLEEFIRNKRQR